MKENVHASSGQTADPLTCIGKLTHGSSIAVAASHGDDAAWISETQRARQGLIEDTVSPNGCKTSGPGRSRGSTDDNALLSCQVYARKLGPPLGQVIIWANFLASSDLQRCSWRRQT